MHDRLEAIKAKYNEVSERLTDPEVLGNYNLLKDLSKEQKDLEDIVLKYDELTTAENNLEEAESMLDDQELAEMAKLEIDELKEKIPKLEEELQIMLVPKDPNDGKDIIMEIRGAAGGDEANIFAGDLFRMYSHYFEDQGWRIEVINETPGASGGYAQIEFIVKGDDVYSKMKYESGSHRVQRVPTTETQGRVHTSTATVLVMPSVEDVNIEVKESDIKMDVYHSSGAGGQSVNTSNSAVRLTHIPTGVVVTCQTERSQLKNRERALALLKSKIYDYEQQKQESELGAERKSKIGTGDRSEKIRTYNYPQNRVTDHRINFSIMELDRVMEGNLGPIIDALINEDMRLKLAGENQGI